MPQPGTIIGDVFEQVREHGKKVVKEVAKAPFDIVKASFEQPISNPSAERTAQMKADDKAKLAKVRSKLEDQIQTAPKQQEDRRIFQGAEKVERGMANQNAQMNNSGQQLSASQTPKKKPEPLVVQQKRQNKLHGAG